MWNFLWLGALLISYALPWLTHPSAALTLNAYDLAEWVALLASSQNRFEALTVALLLRLPLTLIVALTVLALPAAPKRLKWLGYLAGAALVLAQLPPPDAMLSAFNNPNNFQQLALAVSSILFLALPAYRFSQKSRITMAAVLSVAAIIFTMLGLSEALRYLSTFLILPVIGAGAISTIALLALGLLGTAMHWQWYVTHHGYAISGR